MCSSDLIAERTAAKKAKIFAEADRIRKVLLDQGVVLPSGTWLMGLRTKDGAEFGVGPNVTPAGVALAVAAGVSFRAGVLNVPMNFAVVPSKQGVRVSMLTGFTLRK